MVALKNSTKSLNTAVWGRRFQFTMVRGGNEAFLCWVPHKWTWYNWVHVSGVSQGWWKSVTLLTATLSWEILSSMTRRPSLRRSSRLRHLRCCNMSPTLDEFRFLLVTYLAALRWTISILSESIRHGHWLQKASKSKYYSIIVCFVELFHSEV